MERSAASESKKQNSMKAIAGSVKISRRFDLGAAPSELRLRISVSHNRPAKVLLFSLVIALLASPVVTSQTRSPALQWPDSSHYWRILVNVNQYIANRPREWFAQDKVITDLQILDVTPAKLDSAIEQYNRLRRDLESRGMYVGTYISGRTVGPAAEQSAYPPGSVAIEQMPANARYSGTWPGQPERKIIDVRDPDTRHALQAGIRQLWESAPAPLRFVDNAAIHTALGRGEPWKQYCENMGEIRHIAEAQGSRVIFNIAMHVGLMSDEDARELIDAIGPQNGIALEMPWHPNIQRSPQETAKAVARYRQLLDSGMVVVMIPVDMQPNILPDWIRTWRKPSDHIYISGIFWKPPDLIDYSDR
jgi:hypothetical protein